MVICLSCGARTESRSCRVCLGDTIKLGIKARRRLRRAIKAVGYLLAGGDSSTADDFGNFHRATLELNKVAAQEYAQHANDNRRMADKAGR